MANFENYDVGEQEIICSSCTGRAAYSEMNQNKGGGQTMDLISLSNAELETADVESLTDILEIKFNTDLPPQKRLENLVAQVGNPYLFLVGTTPVKVRFAPTGEELSTRLERAFETVKAMEMEVSSNAKNEKN